MDKKARKQKLSQLAPVFVIVLVILIAVFLIVMMGRAILGGKESRPDKREETESLLLNVNESMSVMMTVRGPIVADENFRSFQIEVSPTERRITAYKGYLDHVVKQEIIPNNFRAYQEFVYALSRAQVMKGTPLVGDANDLRGICARSKLTEFNIKKDGRSVTHLWTTPCKLSKGSFEANLEQSRKLFMDQIPAKERADVFKEAKINF